MIDCNFENTGCHGGYLVQALDFLMQEGVASDQCVPYKQRTHKCRFKCRDPEMDYEKYYCAPNSLKILTSVDDIQNEIYLNGPVVVTVAIYEDMLHYKNGVYEQVAGEFMTGHGVRVYGWGHDEGGHLFWLAQNQWSDRWGNQGTVKIKAGQIGIDEWALACKPDLKIIRKPKEIPSDQHYD